VEMLTDSFGDNAFILYNEKELRLVSASDRDRAPYRAIAAIQEGKPDKNYFITSRSIVNSGHTVFLLKEKEPIYNHVLSYMIWIVLAIIVILILVYIVLQYVSNSLTRRLNELIKFINVDIEQLVKTASEIEDENEDEFSIIKNKISELVKRIQQYYKQISEYEIEILQDSINPHLLYNTLASVRSVSNNKKLNLIIDQMVQYYRIILSNGDRYITLNREVTLITKYIELQKFAHDYKFTYIEDIHESLYNCLILKNILQPIIENSLFHGLTSIGKKGILKVSAKKDTSALVFIIEDNGRGIEENELHDIRNLKVKKKCGGYGIMNVTKRIKALYGENYGVHFESRLGEGTKVTIRVPYNVQEEELE